jgi:predicted DNA-binding transcriptional regulator YafY
MTTRDRLSAQPALGGAPVNRETVLRLLAMLHAIPRYPQMKSPAEIARELGATHKVHVRSVQRDLLKLSHDFAFTYEPHGRTQKWFWPRHATILDLPAMDLPVATAFLLSREYLRPLLPPAAHKLITPYFNRAEQVLKEAPGALAAWRKRVCVVPRGPRLLEAKIAEAIQAEVYEAVLSGRQLVVEYRSRGAKASKEHLLNPLGLVVYDGVSYLIATAWNYTNPVTYTLHRMSSAKCTADAAVRPKDFDLGAHAAKEFRFPVSKETIRLVARFDPYSAQHLEERPLSADQQVTTIDGRCEISATVADTEELRWWLLGFGDRVEVLAPAKLRVELRQKIKAAARYD